MAYFISSNNFGQTQRKTNFKTRDCSKLSREKAASCTQDNTSLFFAVWPSIQMHSYTPSWSENPGFIPKLDTLVTAEGAANI